MTEQRSDASTAGVMTHRTVFPFLGTSLVNSGFSRSHSVFSRVVVHFLVRSLSPVVYRFCCQQGSAGGKSACVGRDLQEPVTENTNWPLLEPVKRGSSRKYWRYLSLGIRHQ